MSLTWRDVAPPEASASNQLYSRGIDTVLGGFDKFKGVVDANDLLKKKKEEEDQALLLGQLQAATAGQGASDDIRAILGAGIANGLGGAQLSALASGAVAQGKNLFDQGLDADKLYAQKEQFNASQDLIKRQHEDDLGIKSGQLANQVAGTQADIAINNEKLALQKEELKQRAGESDQDYELRVKEINTRYGTENSKAVLEANKAAKETEKTNAQNSIVSSDKFKSASEEDKALMLAPFMDAKDILGSIDDIKSRSKSKGSEAGMKDAKDLIGTMGLNTTETINAQALLKQGVEAGFDPVTVAAWIDKKENPSTLFEYGQRVGAGSPKFMASDLIEFSREKGYDLPPHLADPETARKLKEAAGIK